MAADQQQQQQQQHQRRLHQMSQSSHHPVRQLSIPMSSSNQSTSPPSSSSTVGSSLQVTNNSSNSNNNTNLAPSSSTRQRLPMCTDCEKSLPNQIVFDKIESIIRMMQDEQNGLPVKTAKSFMSKIPSVFTGIDLIQWMMRNLKLEDQQEAIHLANLIASHGYIFPIEDHTLSIKNDCTFYRFQTPYLWPSKTSDPENTDYAVYLCKRTMQGKTRLELADYEAENLARLQKMFSRKWEFIFMQAESQAKVDKKRDKLERKVLDSQERAFWDVYRPVPGCVNTTELDIKKACRLSKSSKRCTECHKVSAAGSTSGPATTTTTTSTSTTATPASSPAPPPAAATISVPPPTVQDPSPSSPQPQPQSQARQAAATTTATATMTQEAATSGGLKLPEEAQGQLAPGQATSGGGSSSSGSACGSDNNSSSPATTAASAAAETPATQPSGEAADEAPDVESAPPPPPAAAEDAGQRSSPSAPGANIGVPRQQQKQSKHHHHHHAHHQHGHHHHHHHHGPHGHHHHHHHRTCPHHSKQQQQQSAQSRELSIPTESILTTTLAAAAVASSSAAAATPTPQAQAEDKKQFARSPSVQVSSGSGGGSCHGITSSSSSRRKSECNRMLSVAEVPTSGSKHSSISEDAAQVSASEQQPAHNRPASACCSLASLETEQVPARGTTVHPMRKSSLNVGGRSATTTIDESQQASRKGSVSQAAATGGGGAHSTARSPLKSTRSVCGSSSSGCGTVISAAAAAGAAIDPEREHNIGELERELEALKVRLDRRIGGVKMSKVTQSYLSYFKQWAEYDPFIAQPVPSNPWMSDSTELWDSERQTKDVHSRRVRRWAFSLKELLSDPAGREQFYRFLEKEFSAENLKFWDAVQELKRVHSKDVARRVEAIWQEYLAQDANCPINIDSKSYETSKKNMAKNKNNRYIFDEAAGHVYQLMKNDSYPRYLRSEMYKDYKEASEKKRSNQVAFDVFKPQMLMKHKFNF